MKIVHVTNYQVPGYGYEELPLAKAQARLGNEVSIITSNYLHPRGAYSVLRERFPRRKIEPVEEERDGVRIYRMASLEIGTRPWILGLTRRLASLDPDVIHCHNLLVFNPSRIAISKLIGRLTGALVVDDHTLYSVMRRGVRARAFYLFYKMVWHRIIAKGIDRICAVTQETRHYLITKCGVRDDVDVMPLGVDSDAFKESPALRRTWRTRLLIPAGDLLYLYTGKIIEPKGVHLLVSAALRLLDEGLPLRVLIVGDGDPAYVASLRRQIERAGHDERFVFLPSQVHHELPGVYAAADVCVWPRQESMAVFEALATSLPVIVNSGSGYARLVAGCGVTFVLDDEQSLVEAMKRLGVSSRERTEFGRAGRAVVEDGFTWKDSALRYLKVYTTLCRVEL